MKVIVKKFTILGVFVFVSSAFVLGTDLTAWQVAWDVPEEARLEENPLESTPETVESGGLIYKKRCQLCHGAEGKGDGPMAARIREKPSDITPAEVRDRMTDGEIFYKISVGKPPMPSMEGTLTEDEIWTLVNYVRSLQEN